MKGCPMGVLGFDGGKRGVVSKKIVGRGGFPPFPSFNKHGSLKNFL